MALVRADAMFKLYPAKAVYKQKVKLRPNEHHYENDGEEPYIKYSCPICEQLAESAKGFPLYSKDEKDEGGKFVRFSLPKGTEKCPCCGVNIEWDYGFKDGIGQVSDEKQDNFLSDEEAFIFNSYLDDCMDSIAFGNSDWVKVYKKITQGRMSDKAKKRIAHYREGV